MVQLSTSALLSASLLIAPAAGNSLFAWNPRADAAVVRSRQISAKEALVLRNPHVKRQSASPSVTVTFTTTVPPSTTTDADASLSSTADASAPTDAPIIEVRAVGDSTETLTETVTSVRVVTRTLTNVRTRTRTTTIAAAATTSASTTSSAPLPSGSMRKRDTSAPRCRKLGERACASYGGIDGAVDWSCVDVRYGLETCGGCPDLDALDGARGEAGGRDCSAIPHADAVHCARGECVITQCHAGYTLSYDGENCEKASRNA
ncbi:hypothetical protein PLICRDRAFT_169516 [Plicaturopsis crispa FD-325 SS-3]|nr:hypothetical protein PLICRDRAFT_169516 [Plicaturopsis crispa FD-325 SS-3]